VCWFNFERDFSRQEFLVSRPLNDHIELCFVHAVEGEGPAQAIAEFVRRPSIFCHYTTSLAQMLGKSAI